jgi:hypothetical protein
VSYQVLVVPEDPVYNGYILQPLVGRVLEAAGRPNAKVKVLTSPRVRGYDHVKGALEGELLERYAHLDLVLFLPDADGKDRRAEFERLEERAKQRGANLLCCAAVQEVEVWLLAGHVEKLDRPWAEVRQDVSVKETSFELLLRRFGDPKRPGGGRDVLMAQALHGHAGILERCPELRELERRLRALL